MLTDRSHIELVQLTERLNRLPSSTDKATLAQKADILSRLGQIYIELKDVEQGTKVLEDCLQICEILNATDKSFRSPLAEILHKLGNLTAYVKGDVKGSVKYYDNALLHARISAQENPSAKNQLHVAMILTSYGAFVSTRNPIVATQLLEQAVNKFRAFDSKEMFIMKSFAVALTNLGVLKKNSMDPSKAFTLYEEALAIRRRLVKIDRIEHLEDLSFTLANLANLMRVQSHAQAETILREAVEVKRELKSVFPGRYNDQLADALFNFSLFYSDSGDLKTAIILMQESCDVLEPIKDYTSRFLKNYNESLDYVKRFKEQLNSADEG